MRDWKRFIQNAPDLLDPSHQMPRELRYGMAYAMIFIGLPVAFCGAIGVVLRILMLPFELLGLV